MKKLTLVALLTLAPAVAVAAPPAQSTQSHTVQSRDGVFMGLGGSIRSDDTAIYLPIEISPAFRVEPFYQWSETDSTPGSSTETRQLGAGGFFRFEVYDHLQTYAGGRLSFVEMEFGGGDLDGFSIEPTVGIEFWATQRFSLALEAFLYWQDLDGNNGAGAAVENEASGSSTRLLVRFFP
jgi:hypothetical protein